MKQTKSRQNHKTNFELFRVKTAVGIRAHAYERPCTHVKDHVVHVRIRWIMETRKCMHLYPRKRPSGAGIKIGHIRYPSYGRTQKEKKNTQEVKKERI